MFDKIAEIKLSRPVGKEYYSDNRLACLHAISSQATVSFKALPSMYAFFDQQFKDNGIDYLKFLPEEKIGPDRLESWLKLLNNSIEGLANEFLEKQSLKEGAAFRGFCRSTTA